MWRSLLRWLAPLLVAGACTLPAGHAQAPSKQKSAQGGSDTEGAPVPAFQYALAVVAVILVMVIVLMPSRKRS
ncbi:MAG TPA: hypothetical protein VG013_40070 [Gemmataceae bacterium]|nr:hypothetical protein [Gemmataceae bacterium]